MCVDIKHTGGDGIRKMDDGVMSFDISDAVCMLCGLTWTWQHMNWSADEHEARRIEPVYIEPGYIEPGDMIHSVYIERV